MKEEGEKTFEELTPEEVKEAEANIEKLFSEIMTLFKAQEKLKAMEEATFLGEAGKIFPEFSEEEKRLMDKAIKFSLLERMINDFEAPSLPEEIH